MSEGKRRPSRPEKHDFNPEFDKLLVDFAQGKVSKIGLDVVRPAYAYTSQCFKKGWESAGPMPKLKAKPKEEP